MRRFRAPWTAIWLGCGVVLAVLRAVLPPEALVTVLLGIASPTIATGAIVLGVRMHRPASRLPWYLLAANSLCVAFASLVFVIGAYDGTVDFPSWADALYLAAYPFEAAGLLLLVQGLSWRRDRTGLLDALTLSTGLGLTMWLLFMRPLLEDTSMGLGGRLVSVAYPIADLLLISVLIRFFTSPGVRGPAFWLLSASVLLLSGTDVVWLVGTSLGTFCLAGAALHPSMTRFTESTGGSGGAVKPELISTGRVLLLGSACLLTPALLFPQGLLRHGRVDWLATGIGCMVMFVLVIVRMIGMVQQIQAQANQLDVLAHYDSLTGIPNRRAWDGELEKHIEIAGRHGDALVVAIIDLDHFKQYNDSHGHPEGDVLLRDAAAAWRSQLRASDVLARYGGEEFGVILNRTRLVDSEYVMERLLAATPCAQTFSAGLAQWSGTETAAQLVARADSALYSAKRAGRNRWHVSGARPEESLLPLAETTARS